MKITNKKVQMTAQCRRFLKTAIRRPLYFFVFYPPLTQKTTVLEEQKRGNEGTSGYKLAREGR